MKIFVRIALASVICAVSLTARAQSPASAGDRIETILSKMSLDDLQLPEFEMSDGPAGIRSNSRFPSTVYAAGIGLAATWNCRLAERVGQGIGRDARAREILHVGAWR